MMCSEIKELYCDHEEADTRMILHTMHASQSYRNIIIKSPDTDVLLIALNACLSADADILFETGIGTGKRIVSLNKIRHCLGDQWCCSLIGLHASTGLFHYSNSYACLSTIKQTISLTLTSSEIYYELKYNNEMLMRCYVSIYIVLNYPLEFV